MDAARRLVVEVGGTEDRLVTFARDQRMMLSVADTGLPRARVWRRAGEGLCLGRFHRAAPAAADMGLASGVGIADGAGGAGDAGAADGPAVGTSMGEAAWFRRASGGRIVPVGPGVACITLALPAVDWLDPQARLRPEQVLNRAVRPLLALLRGDGIEAFYPGRDLVTVAGRTVAHASFTVARDGTALVEFHVAESMPFSRLADLLGRIDPQGVAGVDRDALASSTTTVEAGGRARGEEEWATVLARAAAKEFACEVELQEAAFVGSGEEGWIAADAAAARDFDACPGPLADGRLVAVSLGMLGVVEASARRRGDRIADLQLAGDLIAPFHALDDVAAECEGEPMKPANVRKALARAFSRPRSFVLGLRDLDELILRMA